MPGVEAQAVTTEGVARVEENRRLSRNLLMPISDPFDTGSQ